MEDKEYQNFLSCCRGFSYVGKALLPYTNGVLNNLYQQIYGKLVGFPRCTDRCSEKHGKFTDRWCPTCLQWKAEIKKSHLRCNTIQWQKTKSWTWPTEMKNILEIFAIHHNLRDISNTCAIWKNCKAFKIDHSVVDRISDLRNTHYGHNPDMTVSDLDKKWVFDAFNELVKHPEVLQYIDARTCNAELERLEKSDETEKHKAELQLLKKDIELIMRKNGDIQNKLKETKKCDEIEKLKALVESLNAKFELIMQNIDEIQNKPSVIDFFLTILIVRKMPVGLTRLIFLFFTLMCCRTITQDIHMVINHVVTKGFSLYVDSNKADCVSEIYTHPFPQDLPLFQYIADHKPLIGRKWLFAEIEQKIFHTKQVRHGLAVVAEMGYGKSALVSHMLCAKQNANGWNFKDNIAAFHVCKFDVPSTMKAGRFIRRLVGFFSTYSAQFGHQLSLIDRHSLIFDEEKCEKEPVACLDQGVLFPLKNVNGEKTWFVVIDALDECFESDTETNNLLDLLKIRIKKFPYWLKFLIFSRDIPGITDLKSLTELRLISSDERNLNDIGRYLDNDYTLIDRMKDYFGTKSDIEVLKEILTESEGNFLFVAFSLEYIIDRYSNNQSLSLPSNLSDFYESNFKRQFKSKTAFKSAKLILQIVCASLNPLVKSDIMDVLHSNNITDDNLIEDSFNKLSFFLRIQKEVTFLHQSIHDWLLSKENENFKIQQEQGHEYLSKYLIEATKRNQSMDVIEMAIHAGKSEKIEIREIFQSINHEYLEPKSLHRLVNLTDSGLALELVMSFVTEIDSLDDNGHTPAFVAASKGHSKQLKLFLAKGANISFTTQYVRYDYDGSSLENIFKMIEYIKTKCFSGYNLLHVAVSNKHINVVRHLLTINSALIYHRNAIGHLPSDIACEYGYTEILQEIAALNHSIVGETCMYLAAKQGHGKVIDFVIDIHTACACISDNTAMLSYNKIMDSTLNSSLKYLDEWWKVFKESALHVAVRNGHYSVVEKLSRYFTHMLNCTDAFGRTPFLASIWYNQTRIFISLNARLGQTIEICSGSLRHLSDHQLLKEFILKRNCQDGFSIAHLLARFDRSEMIQYIKDNKLSLNWLLLDNDGFPAEHYAACYASISYLKALRRNYIPAYSTDDRRYKHGMTVYHSAAMCGRNESLLTLNPLYRLLSFPHSVDDKGRGILLYSALSHLESTNVEIQLKFTRVVNFLVTSGHSLMQSDSDGRNILHYAMLNGNIYISIYIYNYYQLTWYRLYEQKDVTGKTPIELSLSSIVEKPYTFFKQPEHCLLFEIFYTGCENVKSELMSPSEMAVTTLFHRFYLDESGHNIPSNIIPSIYVNSPYVTTAMLLFLNNTESKLRQYLVKTMRSQLPSNNLFKYSLVALAALKPGVLLVYNQPFEESPLHKLAFDKDSLFVDDEQLVIIVEFVTSTFKNRNYPDTRGFNILHYSILGANILLAEQLIQRNVKLVNSRVRYIDLLWMALLPWKGNLSSNWCSHYDSFLYKVITKHVFKHSDFCLNGTTEFSLVHLLSLNGMADTLKVIRDMYGPDIMLCTTKHGFTPYYLWRIYNKYVPRDVFVERPAKVTLPDDFAEEILLHKMFPASIDPLECLHEIRAFYWKMSKIRKKYDIMLCLVATSKIGHLLEWTLYTAHPYSIELNLMLRFERFLASIIDLELILENGFPPCSVVNKIVYTHKELHIFYLYYIQIFNDGTSGWMYLMEVFTDMKNRNMCPLSRQDMYRLMNIISATNHFISKALPRLLSIYGKHVFINQRHLYFNIIKRSVNEFYSRRLEHHQIKIPNIFIYSELHNNINLLKVYKNFRYLNIIKKTLVHRYIYTSVFSHDVPLSSSVTIRVK